MAKQQTYKGNGKHAWEMVAQLNRGDEADVTTRLRVPGGWLYHNSTATGPTITHTSMVFVPLPAVLVQGKGETSKGKHAL